jgi:ubiquinone biosynthesis protein COQ4
MQADPEGSQILIQRPTIDGGSPDPDSLLSLPPNTLGHQYIAFMRRFGISSDTRKSVKFVDDPDLAYLMRRYRETHDLVHLLCRMRPNMLGEVVIKWIEALQTELPMCYGAAIGGALRLSRPQRTLYQKAYLSYAFECGHNAKLLLACHFEKRWEQDLNDLRAELGIPPASHSSML